MLQQQLRLRRDGRSRLRSRAPSGEKTDMIATAAPSPCARHARRTVLSSFLAVLLLGATAAVSPRPALARGPDGIADVAEKVIDAVVNISTSQTIEAKGGGEGRGGAVPQLPPGSPFEEVFEDFFKT